MTAGRRAALAEVVTAVAALPANESAQMTRQAVDLFTLATRAMAGRLGAIGAPSRVTSMYDWVEDLRQDPSPQTFFEQKLQAAQPELVPDLAAIATHPRWPAVRSAVANALTLGVCENRILAAGLEQDRDRYR
jgi:hypothetical protein